MKHIILTATVLSGWAGLAMAQAVVDPAVDTNGDGMYSFPELATVLVDLSEESFLTSDLNGDGLLDMDEVQVATDAGLIPAMDS